MTVIDDIKARLDLVELVSETVKLRKSGRTFTGLCPFHVHKNNTPSFAVWPESGNWRCFGQCNEGGDAFKFIMKRDGVDFAEALRVLAARTGVELAPRTLADEARDDNLALLRKLLDEAVIYFHHLLRNAPQAQPARDHLARRGLTAKAVELFQLGYALDAWDGGLKYFTGKGHSQQDLLDAGLIVAKEDGKVFDRFRDRLMIPVRDERGRMTGFQARALKPDAIPKFMNSPQTALFDKGATLFGLDLARKAVREAGAAIVVEGNLDVVAAHQAGFSNVVSSQGTALTETQMRLLKKYAKRIILALDADAAGDAATLRGLSVAREALDREQEILFDPRGLVKTEGRLGTDIRVMTLPPGLDPDDVINANPEQWRQLVDAAEPVVSYVIRVLTADRNLADPKVKTEVLQGVLPLIEDVAQPAERETYRQQLMRLLRLDEREMEGARLLLKGHGTPAGRRESHRWGRPARATGGEQPVGAAGPTALESDLSPADTGALPASSDVVREVSKLEAFCLAWLLREPALLYRADRELQALGLPRLDADDFLDVEHQLIFGALAAAMNQLDADTVDALRARLDPVLAPRLQRLLDEERSAAPVAPDKAAGELISAVLRLRRRTVGNWLRELRFLAEDAREGGDERAEAYQAEISRQATALAGVDRALARRSKKQRPAPGLASRKSV
jgi:DNA primase